MQLTEYLLFIFSIGVFILIHDYHLILISMQTYKRSIKFYSIITETDYLSYIKLIVNIKVTKCIFQQLLFLTKQNNFVFP